MTRLRKLPPLLAALDSLVALGLAVGAEVWVNLADIPSGGLGAFLRVRVTLLNLSFAVVFAILCKQCATVLGLYDRDLEGLRRLVVRTAAASAFMTGLLALYLVARHARGPIGQILADFLVAVFVYQLGRVLASRRHMNLHVDEPERVIIVGSGRLASKAWREVRVRQHGDRRLLGFFDDRDPGLMAPDIASRLIGTVDALPAYLLRHVVDELIIATPMRSCYDLSQRAVSIAEAAGLRVVCLQDVFAVTQQKPVRSRSSLFIELVPRHARQPRAETAKRVLDVVLAASGLLLFAPLFLVISVALKIGSTGSILSVEKRHGYGRRCFRMFRFRSETGRFLQRTLLDKLPELWNVLLGDMSLVGPQPLSAHDVMRFDHADLLRRFTVRPGVTGTWQVAHGSPLSFEEERALNSSYLEEWSLSLDLKILARTVPAMFKRVASAH